MLFVFFFNTHTANTKPKLLLTYFFDFCSDFFPLFPSLCFPGFSTFERSNTEGGAILLTEGVKFPRVGLCAEE